MVVHVCTPAVQQLPYHMRMTAAKQLCIVNMFMVHVMAQNQTVALTYTHLYSPTPDADKKKHYGDAQPSLGQPASQ